MPETINELTSFPIIVCLNIRSNCCTCQNFSLSYRIYFNCRFKSMKKNVAETKVIRHTFFFWKIKWRKYYFTREKYCHFQIKRRDNKKFRIFMIFYINEFLCEGLCALLKLPVFLTDIPLYFIQNIWTSCTVQVFSVI